MRHRSVLHKTSVFHGGVQGRGWRVGGGSVRPRQQSPRGSMLGIKINTLNEEIDFLLSRILKILRKVTGKSINTAF
jgi:hypothetical protein